MSSSQLIGSVVSLWRYPVKSMMGEELNAAEVTKLGLFGDRAYAVVDVETGKVASAKNPKKWPSLFSFRAAYIEPPRVGEEIPPVGITLPDGTRVRSDDADVDATLSRALGREVKLSRSAAKPSLEEYWPNIEGLTHRDAVTDEPIPEGTFFDAAVVHVLSTTTIDVLRAAYPEGQFEVRRFRPNVVLQTASKQEDFIENGWTDGRLSIGSQVCLKVTGPCPRCVMTTLPQGDLPQDLGILKTAVRQNKGGVGAYASVAKVGSTRRGDSVTFEPAISAVAV
jgi:MOSC domain-containing protein